MAKMNKQWKKIERADNVQEYFWQGEFIQSDQWREPPMVKEWANKERTHKQMTYKYLKDGFQYSNTSYKIDNEIHVTEMTHVTDMKCMRSIIDDGGFKSGKKCLDVGPEDFVWFGLKIEEGQIDYMKENRKRKMYSLMQTHGVMQAKPKLKVENILKKISCSPAFQPISLFGNFKFTLEIQKVMKAYASQFCKGVDPDLRKLGTFAYNQEIMHAILVCPPNASATDLCPLLNDEPVIQQMFETWIWKPHSTGDLAVTILSQFEPDYDYIRWEHVSFAFFVPKNECLRIPDLKSCVSLCLGRATLNVNDYIGKMLSLIKSTDEAEMLISMIAGYLKDDRLFEKTVDESSLVFIEPVNLELVVQHLQKLLPKDFESLHWRPLAKWMNSLTRHSNLLCDVNIRMWQTMEWT